MISKDFYVILYFSSVEQLKVFYFQPTNKIYSSDKRL